MIHDRLPESIKRLGEFSYNLWWSWHPRARELYHALDYPLWRLSRHNPIRLLRDIDSKRLKWASTDFGFLDSYNKQIDAFDHDMKPDNTWIATKHPEWADNTIAYFSAEFAIHNSLPIYAGGLGVLAGDLCKEASDLGLPLVAVGFMYPQGYFHQHIADDGWQQEINEELDFDIAPIIPLLSPSGGKKLFEMQVGQRNLSIGGWMVSLGQVNLYLLDTDLDENSPEDRQLLARLYLSDRESRIQQEIVLGIGGVRLLHYLGIEPAIWHANEGHTAFMMLERVREKVESGTSYDTALQQVRQNTAFTTHTPVPAGHDIFDVDLVDKYFGGYWNLLNIDRQSFINLGRDDNNGDHAFNMTALALRMATCANAVSELHGRVSRKMWNGLWPHLTEDDTPIMYITNGVHLPTWVAPEMGSMLENYFGIDWIRRHDDAEMWRLISAIPDDELWAVRQFLKRKLAGAMVERARHCLIDQECSARQLLMMGGLIDPDALTIAFVRRFAEYKRPSLIFKDMERLKNIMNNPWRPVQIIFAGKSHPADTASKQLLQNVYKIAAEEDFRGRIAFVEDYDMHMARYLVHGVDVWLNTPVRLLEACGTSGMKASINGVLHLSVGDGWWNEGYNGSNGWMIGDRIEGFEPGNDEANDAEAIYRILENEIVPLYYDRDSKGVPHGWISRVKNAMSSIAPAFCARRMLKNYFEYMYAPIMESLSSDDMQSQINTA